MHEASKPLDLTAVTTDDLQRVHPEWVAMRTEWEEIAAVRDRTVQQNLELWLPKGHLEPDGEYEARIRITRWVAEAPTARNRVIGAVFQEQAQREDALPDALMEWAQRVDRSGLNFLAWLETRVAPKAFDFGRCWALIDQPEATEERDNLADQMDDDTLAPFLVAYEPTAVRNWKFDARGKLEWVLILEEGWATDETMGQRQPRRFYRIYERDTWSLFVTKPGQGDAEFQDPSWTPDGEPKDDANRHEEEIIERTQAAHGSPGTVPVALFDVGSSIIANAVQLDLKRLGLESDQSYALFVHGHPQLVIKTESDLQETGIGSDKFLKLRADESVGKEDAFYIAPDAVSFSARAEEIRSVKVDTYRHTGADPTGVIADGESRGQAVSGVSRRIAQETSEGRHTGRLRDRIEEGENWVWRIVSEFLNAPLDDPNPINWPHTIDSQHPDEALDTLSGFIDVTSSRTAKDVAHKRLARKTLGDQTKDVWMEIDDQIEKAKEPEPPTFGGAPFAQDPSEDMTDGR